MSDMDTLIVTFQAQLSDVMETVIKTAMYEVTRLVEDGLLEEVKRRNQEVESLKMQLQWVERKLRDQARKTGTCGDCAKDDVELSSDTAAEKSQDRPDEREGDSVERWTRRHRQEAIPESTLAPDNPTATHSPESQATQEADGSPVMDVKVEEVNKLACSSVHLAGWSGTCDGERGSESHGAAEMTEAQPKLTEVNSEQLLRNVIKQDSQISAAHVSPEELEETHMATDPSLEVDSGWPGLNVSTAGLLQNHRLATEKDCDPAKTRGCLRQTEHELSTSVTAEANVLVAPGRDQISSSPKTRVQNSDALGVTIKQEVTVDYDSCVESQHEEKTVTKSGMAFLSCALKRDRVSSEVLKQNRISHKATVQEVMKLHSKVGSGLRLQEAIQHLHRPIKKPSHAFSNSTATALSIAHSQVGNLNRIPSTSKAAAPPAAPLSVQRVHPSDKQAAPHNRPGALWVSIKTPNQSANSHPTNPLPHPDSHPQAGPKHLLRCGQCGKCFPHPSNLKAHLQTHTGERPFCCSLCGRSFTKLSNLKAHRRVHTGERPYCCVACGKRFTQKCNLKRHQRIHLDV